MSSFFRDSNLFTTRKKGALFSNLGNIAANSKIEASAANSDDNFPNSSTSNVNPKVKPFHEGMKLKITNSINNGHKNTDSIGNNIAMSSRTKSIITPKEEENKEDEDNDDDDNDDDDNEYQKNKEELVEEGSSEDEDEDLEITDVRDIAQDSDNTGETSNDIEEETLNVKQENKNIIQHGTSSKMDNVSMEYLLNTISHLNEKNKALKLEMNTASNQNEKLHVNLNKKDESIALLKHKLSKCKNSMSLFHSLLKDLKIKIINSDKSRIAITEELKKTKENLNKDHTFLLSLKNLVTTLKAQNSANESKIEQKNQRIESLEQRSNDLAGRLSEVKIKNSNLTKEMSQLSAKYESDLFKCTTENNKLIESMMEKQHESFEKWQKFLKFVITYMHLLFSDFYFSEY